MAVCQACGVLSRPELFGPFTAEQYTCKLDKCLDLYKCPSSAAYAEADVCGGLSQAGHSNTNADQLRHGCTASVPTSEVSWFGDRHKAPSTMLHIPSC